MKQTIPDTLSQATPNLASSRHNSFEALAKGIRPKARNSSNDQSSARKLSLWASLIAMPAYYWILLVQVVVITPYTLYMPAWLIIYGLISIGAQLPYVKSTKFATRAVYQTIQIIGFAAGLLALWMGFNGSFSVELGIAFLLLCLVSKLWELYKRRDAYVALNLSLFVLAAAFLLDQGLLITLGVIMGVLFTLLALISLNDDNNVDGTGRLYSLFLLAGQALPLLIILFLFFPRLPPLWSLQLSSQQATTGVSDSMSPGDFVSLSKSTELAFRVEFLDNMPNQAQLYWRGLVFDDFDGVIWSRAIQQQVWYAGDAPKWMQLAWDTVPEAQKKSPRRYSIILEPTQQSWLYGLDYPFSQEDGIAITSVFTLKKQQPIVQQYQYNAVRYPNMRIDARLDAQQRQQNLALPQQGNEASRLFAKQMFEQAGHNPERYITSVHNWMTTNAFRYTLSPPPLGENRVDDFLFNTQAGFCEHYASSFTFLMRAAGVPARVVAGYQGGQVGRDGSSWEVRQMDAHAWSEVWIQEQGWVRVDPTSFVAPIRVEQGMDAFTQQQGAAIFGEGATAQLDYQRFQLAQSLSRLSDQIGYYWQKDIVGYDQDKQSESLFKWFKIKGLMQQMLWMMGVLTLIMTIIITLIWYRRRKKWHPADRPLIQLSSRMKKTDEALAHQMQEGMLAWLDRLEVTTDNEEVRQVVTQVKAQYRKLRYGRLSEMDTKHDEYKLALRELRDCVKKIK